MTLLLAYLAGVLTIATPCILPVLPFVLARADRPFSRAGLPMLLGLALAFAAVASLVAVAGGWAVQANHYGRIIALALMALFGVAMVSPALATRLMAPLVSIGAGLSRWAGPRAAAGDATLLSSVLLGIATGFVWAPCAGPVLGLILTAAALRGPGIDTSLLLLAYGLGAATSLAIALLLGRRLLVVARRSVRWSEGMRRVLGIGVIAGVAAIAFGLDTGALTRLSSTGTTLAERRLIAILPPARDMDLGPPAYAAVTGAAPRPLGALDDAGLWLNSKPLHVGDLRGKVVLVNFWTYSCINCLRILPHVRAWADKYRDRGLIVIGVHTPEFAFEKDSANVRAALGALGVPYPVATDNDFRIWRAFDNEAWPALYFIDAEGRVRHRLLGEGSFDQSERVLQALLAEAGSAGVPRDVVAVIGKGTQAETDGRDMRSPETYIGYAKADSFASGVVTRDAPAAYRTAAMLPLNRWGLAGSWTIGGEFATLSGPQGSISHRFHARDLHLVLGPPPGGRPIRFRVTIDGAAPGASHGSDVDAQGWGMLRDTRLYQLVRQGSPVADRTFRIDFEGAGVRAYAFTFG
jgi:cytochrome c biogenesis protein CcdA/thiol-disulfide isomerase/thioredoxin